MKNLTIIISVCALGVVIFSASKILWGSSILVSWGIFICAIVFVVSLVLILFNLIKRRERAK